MVTKKKALTSFTSIYNVLPLGWLDTAFPTIV